MLAFFLGAGASVECGMPLVWSFTATLRENILKRVDTYLFYFSENKNIRERFVSIISNTGMHYEQMVSELETWMLSATGEERETVGGLITQTTECIQLLLLELQEKCLSRMDLTFHDYFGLKKIVSEFGVLDIYSLNHDLIIEELCSFYEIPLKDGFYGDRDHGYSHLGSFRVATKNELQQHKLDFFDHNGSGINLVKLHGSLDIFAIEDKEKYLKSVGNSQFGSYIRAIRNIERLSLQECHESKFRAVNELVVSDDSGQIQFLRRSLLTGGNKFSEKFEQIAPKELFEEFRSKIQSIRELIVVGYSFGDEHVNEVLENWLNISGTKLVICDPNRTEIPDFIANKSSQVEIRNIGFTDLLLSFDPEGDTEEKRQKRKLINRLNSLPKSEIKILLRLLKEGH
ncbi:hypothetical protein V6C39_21280 [Dickeya ananatis]|uniref:hypothetical protein n=1 Tax=Dickeya ananatis TaxID=3061286 RepID=UPI00388E7D2D